MTDSGGRVVAARSSPPDLAEKPISRLVTVVIRTSPPCIRAAHSSASGLEAMLHESRLVGDPGGQSHARAMRVGSSSPANVSAKRARSATVTSPSGEWASRASCRRRYSPRDSPRRRARASSAIHDVLGYVSDEQVWHALATSRPAPISHDSEHAPAPRPAGGDRVTDPRRPPGRAGSRPGSSPPRRAARSPRRLPPRRALRDRGAGSPRRPRPRSGRGARS